jgi:hypothetical protein
MGFADATLPAERGWAWVCHDWYSKLLQACKGTDKEKEKILQIESKSWIGKRCQKGTRLHQ